MTYFFSSLWLIILLVIRCHRSDATPDLTGTRLDRQLCDLYTSMILTMIKRNLSSVILVGRTACALLWLLRFQPERISCNNIQKRGIVLDSDPSSPSSDPRRGLWVATKDLYRLGYPIWPTGDTYLVIAVICFQSRYWKEIKIAWCPIFPITITWNIHTRNQQSNLSVLAFSK